jgi:hypothetical protein
MRDAVERKGKSVLCIGDAGWLWQGFGYDDRSWRW